MPVELEVSNPGRRLVAGIYATVKGPIRGNGSVLWLPPNSVVTTSERTFVIRVDGEIAQWVDVKRGTMQGPWLRLSCHSKGDTVLRRGSDEIREGTRLKVRLTAVSKG